MDKTHKTISTIIIIISKTDIYQPTIAKYNKLIIKTIKQTIKVVTKFETAQAVEIVDLLTGAI